MVVVVAAAVVAVWIEWYFWWKVAIIRHNATTGSCYNESDTLTRLNIYKMNDQPLEVYLLHNAFITRQSFAAIVT